MSLLRATLDITGSIFRLDYSGTVDALDQLLSALGPEVHPAAEKLGEALTEIDKMLSALDAELVRFLVLDFRPPEIPRDDLKTLIELSAGQAMVNIEEARGHCSRIEVIYDVHLKRWLPNMISSQDSAALEDMFKSMHDADMSVIHSADQVNEFLTQNAEAVLQLLAADQFADANALVVEARDNTLASRRALFQGMAVLRRYESAFIRAAQAI